MHPGISENQHEQELYSSQLGALPPDPRQGVQTPWNPFDAGFRTSNVFGLCWSQTVLWKIHPAVSTRSFSPCSTARGCLRTVVASFLLVRRFAYPPGNTGTQSDALTDLSPALAPPIMLTTYASPENPHQMGFQGDESPWWGFGGEAPKSDEYPSNHAGSRDLSMPEGHNPDSPERLANPVMSPYFRPSLLLSNTSPSLLCSWSWVPDSAPAVTQVL